VQVIIDIDVGLGRTGCHDPEQAAAVARAIAAQPNLKLLGVRAMGATGSTWRAPTPAPPPWPTAWPSSPPPSPPSARPAGAFDVVTGGGTGTFTADAAQGVLNEIQPGSYAFMDREYRDALKSDPDGAYEQSAAIVSTVISANHPKWVTLDAGLKAFSTEGPMPVPLTAKFAASTYRFFGDEHGLPDPPA
jgi:D-serine deaminase-like pyridoxal phosphate-dependent protein